jgi:hypothetical protein
MAMKDAKIKYLEHELEEKERALELLREVDRPMVTGGDDARVTVLDRRVRELEAVVKGLTEEVLDLKALTIKLVNTIERKEVAPQARPAPTPTRESQTPAPTVLVRPRNAEKLSPTFTPTPSSRSAAAANANPFVPPEEMDMIMQPDGTIKPEPRRRNEYIIASNGFQNRRQNKKSPGDRSGRHVDAVIFADETEPPRPPKKR